MSKPTKSEMSDQLNQFLQTAVDFTKMTEEDLRVLYKRLGEIYERPGRLMADKAVLQIGTRARARLAEIVGPPQNQQ